MLLDGKKIIITGGASGIAAGALRALAKEGASTVSFDIDDEGGLKVAAEAGASRPGSVTFRHCDVSDGAQVTEQVRAAVEDLGGLDVMVNLAGLEQIVPADQLTDADIGKVLGVNLLGTVHTNQAAFETMRETGGAIVNIASLAGVVGAPGLASYSASKGAVLGWTRSIAAEWGRYGIRANAVCPLIWTPMFDRHRATMTPEQLEAWDAETAKKVLIGGRYGDPDKDMAPVLVFLASDMSRFITGQTLPVDGGYLILT